MTGGLYCFQCSTITEDDYASSFDPCPECDCDNTIEVEITPCPKGPYITSGSIESCSDDEHDYGRGDHVHEVMD